MLKVYSIILMTTINVTLMDAARILGFFPAPLISHQLVFRPLMHALAERGHQVVVITPNPAFPNGGGPSNLIEVNIHNISYPLWREMTSESQRNSQDIFSQAQSGREFIVKLFQMQMQCEEVKYVLNNFQFDLIFTEAFFRPYMVLAHYFDCPLILISSFGPSYGNPDTMGAPVNPLLYPNVLRTNLDNLTFFENLYELYVDTVLESNVKNDESVFNEINKALIPGAPDLCIIEEKIQLMFLYTHPLWERIRPIPQNVIYIIGIQEEAPKELPGDLKSFLDSSKHGVIYMSFGTSVNTQLLPASIIQLFVNVFSKLPYDVLWKWDGEVLPGTSDNIKTKKWIPQKDVLKHPNLKLFITQGGLSSSFESISGGVPLIGIPMLFDQSLNVENYVFYKIGVRLDLQTLNEENLNATIRRVIEDKSYRENVIKIREHMKDQTEGALNRAVWWTEYVLRHGGADHLRAPAASMPWTEYYEIELVLISLSIILIALYMFTYAINAVMRIFLKSLNCKLKSD